MKRQFTETTQQFYPKLASLVSDSFLGEEEPNIPIRIGPLEINDFSICFWVEHETIDGKQGIYVKIPKDNLYLRHPRRILPITEKDRSFARKEYESLLCLAKFWNNGLPDVKFVTPLTFLEDYNAIVTKREYASDVFRFFRRWDLAARLGWRNDEMLMRDTLQKLAKALARFHTKWAVPGSFQTCKPVGKIRKYCNELAHSGVSRQFLNAILIRLEFLNDKVVTTEITQTLKGLDVRNILMDKSGRLVLLDPGALKLDCREADLARFLVTMKILYWGSLYFGLGMAPQSIFFEAFIDTYYGNTSRSGPLLSLLMIKEFFKQWRMAHVGVLPVKHWPFPIKRLAAILYIDPFYRKQIESEVSNLEKIYNV